MIKVLIVDDEQNYCYLLKNLLCASGFVVEAANRAPEAIDVCRRFRPDILIVDWMLGENISGLELSSDLEKEFPELRTLLMTGFPPSDLEEELRQTQVFAVLEKPFDISRMIELIYQATPGQIVHNDQ